MAKFEFTSPDGRRFEVEGDGSAEDAFGQLQQYLQAAQQDAQAKMMFGGAPRQPRQSAGAQIAETLAGGDNPYNVPSTGRVMPGAVQWNAPGTALAGMASLPVSGPMLAAALRSGASLGTAAAAGAGSSYISHMENVPEWAKDLAKDYTLAKVLKWVGH